MTGIIIAGFCCYPVRLLVIKLNLVLVNRMPEGYGRTGVPSFFLICVQL